MNGSSQDGYAYPDVLGAITGGERVGMHALQFAVGAAPALTYIGQPFEIVIVLQNMADQPLEVKISLGLPTRTPDGRPLLFVTPRPLFALRMSPGEVGVARIPAAAQLPTPQPLVDVPIRVAVRQRVQSPFRFVRAPRGGAPPADLAVTPFQLQALRDVEYVEHPLDQSPESVSVRVSVAAGTVPGRAHLQEARPRYTPLWTPDQMAAERARTLEQQDEARFIAADLMADIPAVFPALVVGINGLYARYGHPLKPGEDQAIARMIAYVMRDHSRHDQDYQLEDYRWFQTLCQVMAYDVNAVRRPSADLVLRHLLFAALHDAVFAAYRLIRPRLRIDLGDRVARDERAHKILTWLAGHTEPDLDYAYLPLALGGLCLYRETFPSEPDPWRMVEDMREAYRQRVRLDVADERPTLDLLDRILLQVEDELRSEPAP
ncbi:MAG: hypothetical protein SF162_16740 [bacterium]|nr:hypothetical protein [bacterium]